MRHPYSAKSRNLPDEPTQMIFDFMNNPDAPQWEYRDEGEILAESNVSIKRDIRP